MKILVSRLRFIGDIVLTIPVVQALREKFPDAVMDYLGDKKGVLSSSEQSEPERDNPVRLFGERDARADSNCIYSSEEEI